jgi:hypothetical protein
VADAPRRRVPNVAEIVGLLGVVVAALGLWANWSAKRADTAAKAAAAAADARASGRVDLVATPRKDGAELLLADPRHGIQEVTIAFPKALGVATQHPAADPVIIAEPLRDPLLKGNDDHAGRLPVLVTTRFVDGDVGRSVAETFDLVWTTRKPLIGGRSLHLDGLRLRQRSGSQAGIDALWAAKKRAG